MPPFRHDPSNPKSTSQNHDNFSNLRLPRCYLKLIRSAATGAAGEAGFDESPDLEHREDRRKPMNVLSAQTAANRRNARKSTGPKTPEGKARSRENALKHGLTGAGIALDAELARAADAYVEELARDWRPKSGHERHLIRQAALAMARLDRAPLIQEEHRDASRVAAATDWEAMRCDEIAAIVKRLRREPSRLVARLSRSLQGVSWMLQRWAVLQEALEEDGQWSEEDRELAYTLLGRDPEMRRGRFRIREDAPREALEKLVAEETRRWNERLDVLANLDAIDRQLGVSGATFDASPLARRFHRYEQDCQRKLNAAFADLQKPPSERRAIDLDDWRDDGPDMPDEEFWLSQEDSGECADCGDTVDSNDSTDASPSPPVEEAVIERSARPEREASEVESASETEVEPAPAAEAEKGSHLPEAADSQEVPPGISTESGGESSSPAASAPPMAGRGKAYREQRRQHRAARLRAASTSG